MTAELEALAEVDRGSRIGRTSLQASVATGIVTLIEYACALQGWDLDPYGDGTGLPSIVAGAAVGLITIALSYAMNRKPPAEPSPSKDVVDAAAAVVDKPARKYPQPPPRPSRRSTGEQEGPPMYAILDFTWKPSADSTEPPAGKAPALVRNDPFDHTFRVTGGWADLGSEEFAAQFRTARLTSSTAGTPAAEVDVETEQDGLDLLIHFHLDASVTTSLASALFFDCQQVGGSTIVAGKAKVLDDVTRAA